MKKILIASDVNGNFKPLLKRLHKFDMAFCVGSTLEANEEFKDILNKKIKFQKPVYFIDNGPLQHALSIKYSEGGEIAPNLHYLGNSGIKIINGFKVAFLSGSENIRKLESRDHTKNILLDKCNIYTFNELSPIFEGIARSENFKGVDILLTCEWPSFKQEKTQVQKCSDGISRLNAMLMPRYHFAGNNDIHIQRPPFINYSLETLKPLHVCRFISLCKFPSEDSKAKGKYLYAFATQPLTQLENDKLLERPGDVQENPFIEYLTEINRIKEKKEKHENEIVEVDEVNWEDEDGISDEFRAQVEALTVNAFIHISGIHYKTRSDEIQEFLGRFGELEEFYLIYKDKGKKSRHKGYGFLKFKDLETTKFILLNGSTFKLNNTHLKFNFTKFTKTMNKGNISSRLSCWFCLSNPEADKSLVVSEFEHMYAALDKGPIEKFHFLVSPKDHLANSTQLEEEARIELDNIEKKLMGFYEEEGRSVIKVERFSNLTQNIAHMIINYVSFEKMHFNAVLDIFNLYAKQTKLEFFELKDRESINDFLKGDEYFVSIEFWDVYNLKKRRFLLSLSEAMAKNLPRNFLREFICQLIDKGEKVNWKDCVRKEGNIEIDFLKTRLKAALNFKDKK